MKLATINYRGEGSAKQFVESLQETGIGGLSNHPIDKRLVEDIYTKWQVFFNSKAKSILCLRDKPTLVSSLRRFQKPRKATH